MMRLKLEIGRSLYGAGYGTISPGGGGTAWSPAALFASGEQGVWYDPSDFSTMFQDSAGTTPVTAVGQPVGKILDKSGRGNHASQSTAAARPVLQQDGNGKYYLSFDGVDDFISATGMTQTTDMDALYGMMSVGNAAVFIRAYGAPDGFAMSKEVSSSAAHSSAAGTATGYVNGVVLPAQTRDAVATAWPDNVVAVIECQTMDLATSWGGGWTFGYYPSFAGLRRLYPGILRQGMTAAELTNARAWVAGKCGVTL